MIELLTASLGDNGSPLRTIAELTGLSFTVPNFQRGYKWGETEVLELLNDIEENEAPQYCLQPLVVKRTGDSDIEFDLIDGQQRCTTIYIILSYLNKAKPPYQIKYQTRESSEKFLKDISTIVPSNQTTWDQFIDQNPDYDNIDNYHFYQAYNSIHDYFANKNGNSENFHKKLLHKTAFIWYEVSDVERSSEVIFQNFNSGKIRLTESELIKAMILLQMQQEPNIEIRELKIAEFAFEWETIEAGLQEKEFWYFLTGYDETYQTRIDILFQLQHEMIPGRDEKREVYHAWEKRVKMKENLSDPWEKLVSLYKKLRDWLEDINVYHRVGYLTATNFYNLKTILEWSNSISLKEQFKQRLDKEIKNKFTVWRNKKGESYQRYAIDKLHYLDEPEAVQNTLLLFNILSYEKLIPGCKFPFWLYNDPDQRWTKEHIHPQNPRAVSTFGEALLWLSEQQGLLTKDDFLYQEIEEVKILCSQEQGDKKTSKELSNKLSEFSVILSRDFNLHGIGNMALLDRITNIEIGNRPFLEKRKQIIETTENINTRLIPLTTRNVFSKYYSRPEENMETSFWSAEDANSYTEVIEKMLIDYLPKIFTQS